MIEELIKRLDTEYKDVDAIVVEGYDGVGKSRILNELSDHYKVTPYRPDYNLWQQFDHRNVDRWKMSGFFWDIFSHFNSSSGSMSMLFDRGVISGAVYNDDMRIAMDYKKMLRDMKVLHILVTCSIKDYIEFNRARSSEPLSKEECDKFVEYTERYIEALEISEVDYLVYENKFDESVDNSICKSCGHYSYGYCSHPMIQRNINGDCKRCDLSEDKEVQDRL